MMPISPSYILGPRSIKKRQSLDYETEIGVSIIIRTTAVLYSCVVYEYLFHSYFDLDVLILLAPIHETRMDNAPFDESLVTPQPRRNDDPLKLDGSVGITFIDREYRIRREAVMRDTPPSSKQPGERSRNCYLPTLPLPNLDDNRPDRRGSQIAAHSSHFEMLSREDSKANGESTTSSSTTSFESFFCTSIEDDSHRRYLALDSSSLPSCTLLPRKQPSHPIDGHSPEESELPFAPLKRHNG